MAVPSTPIIAHRRRKTHQRPAGRRLPWLTLTAVLAWAAGIVLTAVADDTSRALLAVFAVGFLVIVLLERVGRRFADEEQGA